MRAAGLRVETDLRNEKLGAKVREAQLQKIPYMLVVGDQEVNSNAVSLRTRAGDRREALPVAEFQAWLTATAA